MHADYNCCAVCDCEMDYVGADDARTKEDICKSCIRTVFMKTGLLILDGEELLKWIEFADLEKIVALGIWPCRWGNEIDDAVKSKLEQGRLHD